MSEREIGDLSSDQLNKEFCSIFDLLPSSMPESYLIGDEQKLIADLKKREKSSWKDKIKEKLEDLLIQSELTQCARQFFLARFETNYVYGLTNRASDELFKGILTFMKTNSPGVFEKNSVKEIEEMGLSFIDYEVDALEREIRESRTDHPEAVSALAQGKRSLELWKKEFKIKYGEEPVLPDVI